MTDKKLEFTDEMFKGALINDLYIEYLSALMANARTLHLVVQELGTATSALHAMSDAQLREHLGGDLNPQIDEVVDSYKKSIDTLHLMQQVLQIRIQNVERTGCACGQMHTQEELDRVRESFRQDYEQALQAKEERFKHMH